MAAKKYAVSGEQFLKIDKRMSEIKRQLAQKGGSPIDPEHVALVLQQIIDKKHHVVSDQTRKRSKDTIMLPRRLSAKELVERAERDINLTKIHISYFD